MKLAHKHWFPSKFEFEFGSPESSELHFEVHSLTCKFANYFSLQNELYPGRQSLIFYNELRNKLRNAARKSNMKSTVNLALYLTFCMKLFTVHNTATNTRC